MKKHENRNHNQVKYAIYCKKHKSYKFPPFFLSDFLLDLITQDVKMVFFHDLYHEIEKLIFSEVFAKSLIECEENSRNNSNQRWNFTSETQIQQYPNNKYSYPIYNNNQIPYNVTPMIHINNMNSVNQQQFFQNNNNDERVRMVIYKPNN